MGNFFVIHVIASRVLAKTWQSLLFVLLLTSPAYAFMVSPLSPENQLNNACYAGYFEVTSNQKITDPNGFQAIVYKFKCLDPIKGCKVNEEIEIKMADVAMLKSANVVPYIPLKQRFVGFLACASQPYGFSQFIGMPQNSLYLETNPGKVKVPEMEQGRTQNNDPLINIEINKQSVETQSSNQVVRKRLNIESDGTTNTQELLERYRQIKRLKEAQ